MCVGQRTAVQASIYFTLFPTLTLIASYPCRAFAFIKSSQRRRGEQVGGIQFPLIIVVGGKLPTVWAFPPAQATVGKQELGQPNSMVGSIFLSVEPLGGRFIQRLPGPIVITLTYPAGGNQLAEVVK